MPLRSRTRSTIRSQDVVKTTLIRTLPALIVAPAVLIAQVQPGQVGSIRRPGFVTVTATTAAELRNWDAAIDRMVRANQLIVTDVRPDPDIEGRTHETLSQHYQGVPVYGGSITRQEAGGVTVSIFGALYEGIAIDVAPTLAVASLETALVDTTAGARLVRGDTPRLIVYPRSTAATSWPTRRQ
jgi:Fungalysin/Thermolysin Propeptide Motif